MPAGVTARKAERVWLAGLISCFVTWQQTCRKAAKGEGTAERSDLPDHRDGASRLKTSIPKPSERDLRLIIDRRPINVFTLIWEKERFCDVPGGLRQEKTPNLRERAQDHDAVVGEQHLVIEAGTFHCHESHQGTWMFTHTS
jgi:hypothetical protein